MSATPGLPMTHLTDQETIWDVLPDDLQYLAAPASIYVGGGVNSRMHQFVDQILADPNSSAFYQLSSYYNEMAQRGDAVIISQWLFDAQLDGRLEPAHWLVQDMLRLFEILAEREVEPFSSREVRYIDMSQLLREPNWSRVPDMFSALIPAAEHYAPLMLQLHALPASLRLDEEDFAVLTDISDALRSSEVIEPLCEWLATQDLRRQTEALQVEMLVRLLEQLRLL